MTADMSPQTAPRADEMSPEHERRWDKWQRANAADARRTGLITSVVEVVAFTAAFVALVVALLR